MKIISKIQSALKAFTAKIREWLKKKGKKSGKKLKVITETQYKRLQARIALVLMLMLFISGYIILATVDGVFMRWCLGFNLITIANAMIYLMK